jgi:hypothetical protein
MLHGAGKLFVAMNCLLPSYQLHNIFTPVIPWTVSLSLSENEVAKKFAPQICCELPIKVSF